MSKAIYPVLFAALLLSIGSCKEQPILIGKNVASADSTYVTTPETPQQKKILATELTGVQCPNCPAGAVLLDTLGEQNNDALVIVSMHAGVLTTPFSFSHRDLRTQQGMPILNQIFGGDPSEKPAVCYNRLQLNTAGGNPYFITSASLNWAPKLTEALSQENPVLINLSASSHYNSNTGKYDIRVKAAYNQEITGNQKLNIYLTEDSIVDVQETPLPPPDTYDSNYVFMNVFRYSVTGVLGTAILDSLSTKEAGRVFIFNTSIALEPPSNQSWNPAHMNVVAFISDASSQDNHIYQVAKCPLE